MSTKPVAAHASETSTCGAALICKNSLVAITDNTTPDVTTLAAKKGWYLVMSPTEQVVTSAITIYGKVTFSTHTPSTPKAGSCTSNLGKARVYNISYADASSANGKNNRYEDLPPIGLPPSPVAGMVTLDTGETIPFCIGCSPQSPLQAEQPKAPPGPVSKEPKRRVYWYIER